MTKRALFILVCILLLQGCSHVKTWSDKLPWNKDEAPAAAAATSAVDPNCPQVGLMPGLNSITQLRDDKVISETVFTNLTSTCKIEPAMATVRLNIGFKGTLGPVGVSDAKVAANYTLPYLIAVLDPKGQIIAKDVFAISLTYKNGQAEQALTDVIEQLIPVANAADAKNYKIMLGFQLNEQELDYNRKIAAKDPK